jgi:hypothetical protein
MFFEVLNNNSKCGEIGIAISRDGFTWSYKQIILTEPFHLSYPYVFKYDDSYYMIPESQHIEAIRLYKASEFPFKWTLVKTILEGQRYTDNTIFNYNNKWYLFSSVGDELLLYFSDELTSSWSLHPKNPIIKDRSISRQGGRVLMLEDRIIRYAQGNRSSYGESVIAFQITELTVNNYAEICLDKRILEPSGTGWNCDGMHHIDPVKVGEDYWVACVDGKRFETWNETIGYYFKRLLRT